MEGLVKEASGAIEETEKGSYTRDAALIMAAQKIEHYEICGYGTARAFARELNLMGVTQLLEETLNEEYEADDLLTELAVGRLNQKAEIASGKTVSALPSETFSEDNIASGSRAVQERSTAKEMEPEMVSDSTSAIKKQNPAKNKAPKGEAERTESIRETSTVRRTTANNNNTKKAKSSGGRKATEGRSTKTKRSR